MKNKEIIFEFINDWYSLKEDLNWYSLNIINIYIEHEKWLKGWDVHFVLLGLGFYIRFNYDLDFLNKKLSDWEAEELNETE